MKEDLIQSINSYMETVEQKLNSLDKRVAELEQNLHTLNQENDNLRGKLQQMETLLVAANQQMVQMQIDNKPAFPEAKPVEEPEPEVIMPEEPLFEEQALSIDDLPEATDLDDAVAMPMDDMPDLVPVTEPLLEPASDALFEPLAEPVAASAQPIAEPEITPLREPAPAHPTPPQPAPAQLRVTTLFGSPVSDIRQAISLGDRFLFQRELFEQSGEKMQKTLDAINKCRSYDEAVDMLDATFHWDKETTAYTLFMAALQRRFS